MNKIKFDHTVFFISQMSAITLNFVDNISFRVFNIFLYKRPPGKSKELSPKKFIYNWDFSFKFKNLNNIGDLLLVTKEKDKEAVILDLPDDLVNRLTKYLVNREKIVKDPKYVDIAWFDCASFVCYMNDWTINNRQNWLNVNVERIDKWRIDKLPAWTSFFTHGLDNQWSIVWTHYSIVLWSWLILSKTWIENEISVTTVEELSKVYCFDNVYILSK